MKQFFTKPISLAIAFLLALSSFANTVIVKGTVKYSNGNPVSNQEVKIWNDSLNTPSGCYQVHYRYTNFAGQYQDTVSCTNANIVLVYTATPNCAGTYLTNTTQVNTSTNIAESNFTICTPQPNCVANFTYNIYNYVANFTSTSIPISGSSIIGYSWNFGDGTSSSIANPSHTYSSVGNYTVKLSIASSNAGTNPTCYDSVIKTITITPPTSCLAALNLIPTSISNVLSFSSTSSYASQGDSIISRKYFIRKVFGITPGPIIDSIVGNQPNVTYQFTDSGYYYICLAIKTAGGCSRDICQNTAFINMPQVSICSANFTFNNNGLANGTLQFTNTSTSAVPTTTNYIWNFGDGSQSTVANPLHSYTTSGVYNVCLKLIAANGCRDSICKTITVTIAPPTTCVANFTSSSNGLANGVYQFTNTSTSATPTATTYVWNFGNGTTSTLANPVVTFATAGTYNVCLKLQAANGCRDSICKTITVTITPPTTCVANFTSSSNGVANGVVQFNSTSTTSNGTITSYVWNFGNGSFATTANPVATYLASGVYNVCLTIMSSTGCRDTLCKTITVTNTPPTTCVANFSVSNLQGNTYQFNSSASVAANSTDVIVKRRWVFGDGSVDTSGIVSPVHSYANYGIYTACLTIKTAAGCESTVCKTIVVSAPVICHAAFTTAPLPATTVAGWSVKFNSNVSTANDTIVERKWSWGDGSTTGGNVIDPTHVFLTNGTYTVCLKIRSASGCTDSTCTNITVPFTNQLYCAANFTYTPVGQLVKFNGRTSAVPAGDSIIQYKWEYGDGQIQTGLLPEPQHQYAQTGVYNVCLTIKTTRGCENKICKAVVVPQSTFVQCVPHFTFERVLGAARTIRFNSITSWVPTNDSIIERKWTFGDGSTPLLGNVVNPLKQYATGGIYTACLRIKTALGCINEFCKPVPVDSGYITPPNAGLVKIISLYPNPCTVQLSTVVWCGVTNLSAQLAVYDVYGVKKWSIQKTLLAGNNYTVIPTGQLASGPYFFRVTTMYGVQSKPFYKF